MNGDGTIDYEEFLAATINRSKLEREELLRQVSGGALSSICYHYVMRATRPNVLSSRGVERDGGKREAGDGA